MQVSIAEAAQKLKVSEQTIRRRIKSGDLPSTQVGTPQGYIWIVELPDNYSTDSPESGEIKALRELVENLQARIAAQEIELESRRHEAQEFLFLLQQAALPAPRSGRSWWRWWRRD
jgi:hypothetical protein